jgi:hypothetical protein
MKTNELLLITVSVSVMNLGHTQIINDPNNDSKTNMFRMFNGGINALYSDQTTKGGIDLSVQTYHYYLVTGKRDRIDSVALRSGQPINFQDLYRGFEFFLLNRAAIDFDTTGTMASDYISSLQPSPLTLRFVKELFLTKNKSIPASGYTPVLSIKLTGDSRIIPYNYRTEQINIGASGNFFVTLSTQFTRLEFDQLGKEIDRGTMYIQPSFGIGIGNNELLRSVLVNPKDKVVLSSECRLGFRSHTKKVNDCCLMVRYGINELIGPKLRAGLILSSFN